jgi:hypothetical protein
MASFSSSEALSFAGAEGGGAGVVAGAVFVELGWPKELLRDRERLNSTARMT